jgi:hypothetical protein
VARAGHWHGGAREQRGRVAVRWCVGVVQEHGAAAHGVALAWKAMLAGSMVWAGAAVARLAAMACVAAQGRWRDKDED